MTNSITLFTCHIWHISNCSASNAMSILIIGEQLAHEEHLRGKCLCAMPVMALVGSDGDGRGGQNEGMKKTWRNGGDEQEGQEKRNGTPSDDDGDGHCIRTEQEEPLGNKNFDIQLKKRKYPEKKSWVSINNWIISKDNMYLRKKLPMTKANRNGP